MLPYDHNSWRIPDSLEVRFWERVVKTSEDECWEWVGYKTRSGYGRINLVGSTPLYAHRVSWELHNNRVFPEGLVSLHTCNNKGCVNPHHILVGTQSENIHMAFRDGLIGKPWANRTCCRNGHEYSNPVVYDRRGYRLCIFCKPKVKRFARPKTEP